MFNKFLIDELYRRAGKRRSFLSPKSERFLNWTVTIWGLSTLIVALFVDAHGVGGHDCAFCRHMTMAFPFIEESTRFTRHADTLALVWIFLLLSSPFVFIFLFIRINDVKKGDIKPLAFLLSIVAVGIAGHFISGGVAWYESSNSYFAISYRESFFNSVLHSFVLWMGFTLFMLFCLLFLTSFGKK